MRDADQWKLHLEHSVQRRESVDKCVTSWVGMLCNWLCLFLPQTYCVSAARQKFDFRQKARVGREILQSS